MRRKKILALILTACLVLSVVVWKGTSMLMGLLNKEEEKAASNIVESPEENSNLRDTVIYYKDDKGFLVPVMRKIPWPEGRGIGKAALRALVDNPANRQDMEEIGLTPVLPANTEIRGMSINEGICKVDFTKDFLNYVSKEEEQSIVKAVVYTLTEFPTIGKVRIMIDGKYPDRLTYGTDVSHALTREDINYVGKDRRKGKVMVYYQGTVNGIENYFVPVTKDVALVEGTPVTVIDVLQSLVEGPPENSGLYSVIPEGVQVRNVDVIDGVAYVDFSKEILDVEDGVIAQDIIKSVALTLKEYYKYDVPLEKVSILAEGEAIEFGEVSKEEPAAVPTFANEY
ncbi:MAG: germination protein [Candidatus Petromonas sp.]|jgi:germination protein M|nr:germination protein [Candidatus Petromonas sp.]